MTNSDFVILIIFITWFLAFVIALILYLINRLKYKKLKTFIDKKTNLINKYKKEFILEKIKINYSLNENENCYYKGLSCKIYNIKIKKMKINKKLISKIDVYITNFSIVVLFSQEYIKYNINNIDSYYLDQKYINGEWLNTVFIKIQNDKFFLIDDALKIYFTINKLLKGE
ncbi:hypothetical protein [Spiroplasma turonicum]|uniref:Uncharacterized protein n=1 Tax=Spiroplasma turonicum TaxID=216946 RepID=A0A0K1P634_9MOLU|nr:hypothetical protein [Spiroplasma turonicum]AKU79761.1 hypothetical protein STURON_00515 [Spiroplasma turonicum]ALX70779.1 hypothetical protein STURO_v1c05130 [Spiroplasma turonicum]